MSLQGSESGRGVILVIVLITSMPRSRPAGPTLYAYLNVTEHDRSVTYGTWYFLLPIATEANTEQLMRRYAREATPHSRQEPTRLSGVQKAARQGSSALHHRRWH